MKTEKVYCYGVQFRISFSSSPYIRRPMTESEYIAEIDWWTQLCGLVCRLIDMMRLSGGFFSYVKVTNIKEHLEKLRKVLNAVECHNYVHSDVEKDQQYGPQGIWIDDILHKLGGREGTAWYYVFAKIASETEDLEVKSYLMQLLEEERRKNCFDGEEMVV